MFTRLAICLFALIILFTGCSEETEDPNFNLEQEYQPLAIGNFWIYEVDETIYFGENDFEINQFFYRDRVRTNFLNAENETVYIVERSKSMDRVTWTLEYEYTLMYRDRLLLRTINNTPIAALVFPPDLGRVWNGKVYQAEGEDEFVIEQIEPGSIVGFEGIQTLKVNQEDLDDEITIRDIRYEVFGREVGLIEKYDEVLTYCSRNDCLGQKLIDGGSKTHLTLEVYGKN